MTWKIIVIGAGIGGLATALRLSKQADVTLLEAHSAPGGKMRALPSAAGPVDAGPTVMTMRPVFEDLFRAAGSELADEITLISEDILARHHWPDGSALDLFAERETSEAAVEAFAGPKARRQFSKFCDRAKALFTAFDAPMMKASEPKLGALTAHVLRHPSLIPAMAPGLTLAQSLARGFSDPRLQQLFGRYATYVGGSPYESPAVLALIWQAEAAGVWRVQGGMHAFAQALSKLADKNGVEAHYDAPVDRVEIQGGRAVAVHAPNGRHAGDAIVYAGDPRALSLGLLGDGARTAVKEAGTEPRSLSAFVWAFAAKPEGVDLTHHNVFFADDPRNEFNALTKSEMPKDGTLYVCAQDRGTGATPDGLERFEIILNGPARPGTTPNPEEITACQDMTFTRLQQMGLRFSPTPETTTLTTPEMFNHLFPGSAGSLYGRSPHGMMAAFQRPTARSLLPGLYLAGGGAHPGAGIPMAALSGHHAAAAIAQDLGLTSTSRQTATPGGISTGSLRMANARSPSSPS